MKTKKQIVDKLKIIIEEISLGAIKASNIKSSAKLIDDVGLDSLDYASVMLSCEDWMGLKIKEDSVVWGNVTTVENLADLFLRHQ
jgi:acyl carrier protein